MIRFGARMQRITLALFLVPLAALAVVAVPGRTIAADPFSVVGGGSISLEAESLEIDVNAGTAVLTGKVALKKGDLAVSCPRVDLKFDQTPHVTWVRGSGGVSADVRGVHADAPEVEVDMARQSMELRGGVRLTRGSGFVQAEKAVIDLASAKVTLTQVKGSVPVPSGK